MLGYSDWIVGGVSILLGMALCFGAATSAQLLFDLPKVRWLERASGRAATRTIIAILGLLMIGLGVLIVAGWKVEWSAKRPNSNASAEATG